MLIAVTLGLGQDNVGLRSAVLFRNLNRVLNADRRLFLRNVARAPAIQPGDSLSVGWSRWCHFAQLPADQFDAFAAQSIKRTVSDHAVEVVKRQTQGGAHLSLLVAL